MKLSIVTAVSGRNEVTQRFLDETLRSASQSWELVVLANGSTDDEAHELELMLERTGWRTRLETCSSPIGSGPAFNAAVQVATGDVIAMLHNDLLVRKLDWDVDVLSALSDPRAGVVGFHGALGIGSDDIYKTPYRLPQLARWGTLSDLEEWEKHGGHVDVPTPVAVLDGLALCCRRRDFLAWGGFDEGLGPHHMYDVDLCLRAMLDHGRTNWVLPVRALHLNGQTANAVKYASVADSEVHRMAHERFYEKYRGRLPARVG